jgi:hypothetical protein
MFLFVEDRLIRPHWNFFPYGMCLTPSPRLWVRIHLNQVFPLSLDCTLHLIWSCFDHMFHLYWTPHRWLSTWPIQNSILTTMGKQQLIQS